MAWTPRILACPPRARAEALELLYRRVPKALRPYLIAEVLDEAERGLIDFSGLWIAVRGRTSLVTDPVLDPQALPSPGADATADPPLARIIGVILTQPLSPKSAAVWVPEVRPSWRRRATAAALVHAALADLKSRGFRLAQAVLDESVPTQGGHDLARGGLPRVTDLVYMERATRPPIDEHSKQWEWVPFRDATEADFRAAMQATYRESLDMPELGGTRSLDDIIADHRASFRFEPERWRLGRIPGEPESAAVVLLAEVNAQERKSWEVVYLGLTPSARGRGLGRAAIAHALELAGAHADRLELAVDVRNRPALRLYESSGFTVVDRRVVHLAIFES